MQVHAPALAVLRKATSRHAGVDNVVWGHRVTKSARYRSDTNEYIEGWYQTSKYANFVHRKSLRVLNIYTVPLQRLTCAAVRPQNRGLDSQHPVPFNSQSSGILKQNDMQLASRVNAVSP